MNTNNKKSKLVLKAIEENVISITEHMETYGAVAYLESIRKSVDLVRGLTPGDYQRFLRKIDYKIQETKKKIVEPY